MSAAWSLYMWEPCLSPHKLDLFEALRRSSKVREIAYIAQTPLPPEREALGWSVPELPAKHFTVAPCQALVEEIVATSPCDAVHIFSGIHWTPCIAQGIAAAIWHDRHFGIMTEPRAFEGVKGYLRYAHSWATEGAVRRRADFVLAIGRNGPPWFASVGYDRARIFPFAYFLPFQQAERKADLSTPQVSFLGRLTTAKGIDLFLDALALLQNKVVSEVAGCGPREAAARAAGLPRGEGPRYRGVIAMTDVPAFLARTDILVAPSLTRDDGWGAVISEALMQGAAVVATDRVGGSICLDADWRGRVISSLTPRVLARAIDDLIDRDLLVEDLRQKRAEWARNRLTGEAGASHLLDILSHLYASKPRPAPFYLD